MSAAPPIVAWSLEAPVGSSRYTTPPFLHLVPGEVLVIWWYAPPPTSVGDRLPNTPQCIGDCALGYCNASPPMSGTYSPVFGSLLLGLYGGFD